MPRASCYLSQETIQEIEALSKETNQSFSAVMKEIVQLGLKHRSEDEQSIKYLRRILNISADIYRHVFDEEDSCSKFTGKSANENLKIIEQLVEEAHT